MTEDQTRSYRNSLRGTNYGRTVYGAHNKPRPTFESRGGAEEDDENIFDQSGSSENNDDQPNEGQAVDAN